MTSAFWEKVYVFCGDTVFHGTFDSMTDGYVLLSNASISVVNSDGDIQPTYLHGRSLSIVKEKITAIMDGEEKEEVEEEGYLGE